MVQRIRRNSQSIKKYISIILSVFVTIFFVQNTVGQSFITSGYDKRSFDNTTHIICESIYKYDFKTSDSLLKVYTKKNPTSYWPLMLNVNYLWWQIMSGNDKDQKLLKQFSFEINYILLKYNNPKEKLENEELYFIANAYAFKTRLNLLQQDYIKAVLNLNKCLTYIEQTLGKEDKYEAFIIQAGLLYYFIEYSKKNKPIAKPYLLTLPEGSMAKGIALLEKGTKSIDNILQIESNYFLGKIYLEVEKNYAKAEPYIAYLVKKYPGNIIYRYNYFVCLLNQSKSAQARKEYVAINLLSKSIANLNINQRMFFINEAKKQTELYYRQQAKQ